MQRRGEKPIVYLDQNWISEISKSRISGREDQDKPYFNKLFTTLNRGVTEGKFVCPTSQFHFSESAFIPKLRKPIGDVASKLSRGLSFKLSSEINHDQLLLAALELAELDAPSVDWWDIPFNRDPDGPLPGTTVGDMGESVLSDEITRDWKRLRDGPQTSDYRTHKKVRASVGLSYEGEVAYGLSQLFMELYFGPLIAVAYRNIWQPSSNDEAFMMQLEYHSNAVMSINKYVELDRIFSQGGGVAKFLTSSQFESAPFISILANLRAADIVNYPNTVPKPSLHNDFTMAATILPYTDIFATDKHLAGLIKQKRLDTEYNCRVYRMNQEEDLLEALQAM